MSVANTFDAETGVVHCMGGFEDGSVLVWDTRNTGEELARLKLFSEPGIYGIKKGCCMVFLLLFSFVHGLQFPAILWYSWLSNKKSRNILSLHKRGKFRALVIVSHLVYLTGKVREEVQCGAEECWCGRCSYTKRL